jgi:integrase/recombinase XerD
MDTKRTAASEKAKAFIKLLKKEKNVDYNYLREIFRKIRQELNIQIDNRSPRKLPYVPTEEELNKYYQAVWQSRNMRNMVMMKTLLYTGVRVSELINIKISDVDLDECKIHIVKGKGNKDRIVPFPQTFREILGLHIDNSLKNEAVYLFESTWKRKFTDRGIRKIMEKYTQKAGIENSISPHSLRHFLFTWLKKKGLDDALIQPYSGHDSRLSLEMYSKLSLNDCQDAYENQIKNFPI